MKLFLCTLRFGEPDWLKWCAPTLDDWCHYQGVKLHLYGNDYPHHPSPKFCAYEMLQDFLKSKDEMFMYVDSDVIVHPQTPVPEFGPGFHAKYDVPHDKWMPRWREWCKRTFGESPDMKFIYRNAGVWACDRKSAEIFLNFFKPPFVEAIQDQHFWNAALSKAVDAGMKLNVLDDKWNSFPGNEEPAWFYHILGTNKERQIQWFEHRNLIPRRPEVFPELPVPTAKRAIVYPWKGTDATWQELRYSLRSVEKFFEDKDCEIHILGTERPGWLLERTPRVKFHSSWSYTDALSRGLQMAEKVLWMNDDIVLLKPTTWADVETPLYLKKVTKSFREQQVRDEKNSWQTGLVRAVAALEYAGTKTIYDCSTHTPYVFEREKALNVFRKHGLWAKMPLESLYYSTYPKGIEPLGTRKAMKPPFGEAQYLNYSDTTLTPELKHAIVEMFPDYAPWELKIKFKV